MPLRCLLSSRLLTLNCLYRQHILLPTHSVPQEMAQISSFYPLGILCLFLLRFGVQADGESTYETVLVSSLVSSPNCTRSKGFRDGAIPVVHRAGPCSAKPARRYGAIKALAEDNLRVSSLQTIASGSSSQENDTLVLGSKVILTARSGAYLGSGNYVVTVGFGTPRRAQTVIFDTGSFVSWIQCRPCLVSCYPQVEPVFDPSLSFTYRRIGCTDPACLGLSRRGCSGTTCVYQVGYGDGSSTTGFLSADTFALTQTTVFTNFVFGCGQDNRGLFRGVAGLLGLGRNSYSLNAQVSNALGNIFSYCIPSSSSTTGFLNIGQPLSPNAVYTPLVIRPGSPGFYFIDLIGISVGGITLPIPVDVFRGPGTIIDSGTVITRLPPEAYTALRTAFRAAMIQYPLGPAVSILDTCYDFRTFSTITYPVIRLIYSGATIPLPFSGVFFQVRAGQSCLAFAGNASPTGLGIIGNTQQKTFEVVHDNIGNRIGFAAGGCS
ncbi:aspartyl protease family protein At5g10770-like [Wolffia australiana]